MPVIQCQARHCMPVIQCQATASLRNRAGGSPAGRPAESVAARASGAATINGMPSGSLCRGPAGRGRLRGSAQAWELVSFLQFGEGAHTHRNKLEFEAVLKGCRPVSGSGKLIRHEIVAVRFHTKRHLSKLCLDTEVHHKVDNFVCPRHLQIEPWASAILSSKDPSRGVGRMLTGTRPST